tara:strand:- start:414 stop:644 length:231 start_codon:yes stop_codon:yes gene_type:complete
MNLEIFLMDGYGIYVWSAFIFAFIVCFALYLKTKKTLTKVEIEYKEEVNKLSVQQVETLSAGKISKEILTTQVKAK